MSRTDLSSDCSVPASPAKVGCVRRRKDKALSQHCSSSFLPQHELLRTRNAAPETQTQINYSNYNLSRKYRAGLFLSFHLWLRKWWQDNLNSHKAYSHTYLYQSPCPVDNWCSQGPRPWTLKITVFWQWYQMKIALLGSNQGQQHLPLQSYLLKKTGHYKAIKNTHSIGVKNKTGLFLDIEHADVLSCRQQM